jgi:L-fuculose-phosphate aldolase
MAIVHTHSVHATAWSFLGEPLDTGTKEFGLVAGGAVRIAPEAPPGTDAIARAAVEALDGRRAALLGRHGVLGLGDSPARALDVCAAIEQQAELAWLLRRA